MQKLAILDCMTHDEVHDKATFTRYVAALIAEIDDPIDVREWQNRDIRSLLEAIEAWALDIEGPAHANPWRHAADVLGAGRTYE